MTPLFRPFIGPVDWGWFKQHSHLLRVEDTSGITAVDLEKNETVGMVIFDNWTDNSVQCHIVIKNPLILRHGFLEECMDYVFNQRGLNKAIGIAPSTNKEAIALDKHMGFVEVARIADAFKPGIDAVIMEMTRETSKYIPEPRKVAAVAGE